MIKNDDELKRSRLLKEEMLEEKTVRSTVCDKLLFSRRGAYSEVFRTPLFVRVSQLSKKISVLIRVSHCAGAEKSYLEDQWPHLCPQRAYLKVTHETCWNPVASRI